VLTTLLKSFFVVDAGFHAIGSPHVGVAFVGPGADLFTGQGAGFWHRAETKKVTAFRTNAIKPLRCPFIIFDAHTVGLAGSQIIETVGPIVALNITGTGLVTILDHDRTATASAAFSASAACSASTAFAANGARAATAAFTTNGAFATGATFTARTR
jgi:hypothetical protein